MTPESQDYIPGRPMHRPSMVNSPMQRSNYGIPPRQQQPTAAPAGPRHMDMIPTTAAASQPMAQPNAAPTPPVAAPTPVARPTYSGVQPPKAPLFEATKPAPVARKQRGQWFFKLLPKLRFVCLALGILLVLGGAARWATAGSISGYTIAVGAVTTNDGHTMTIQYTADDSQLHRFTVNKSVASMIPGTSLQVAYRPGAADATVKQVSVVQHNHNLGVQLFAAGVVVLVLGSILVFVHRRQHRSKPVVASAAVPVTS